MTSTATVDLHHFRGHYRPGCLDVIIINATGDQHRRIQYLAGLTDFVILGIENEVAIAARIPSAPELEHLINRTLREALASGPVDEETLRRVLREELKIGHGADRR